MTVFASLGLRSDVAKQGCHGVSSFLQGDASWERGHCEVIIVGALAQILAFAQQKTTAAYTGDSGTFLMVAGVGFEPTTFRL